MRLHGLSNAVRQHFRYDGVDGGVAKHPYDTEAEARAVATRDGKGFYRCTFCGGWHVGGRKGRKKGTT